MQCIGVKSTKLTFEDYERVHGRKPSMKVPAAWCFQRTRDRSAYEHHRYADIVTVNGTLAAAKRSLPWGLWAVLP